MVGVQKTKHGTTTIIYRRTYRTLALLAKTIFMYTREDTQYKIYDWYCKINIKNNM